jgi:hypothetical protein
VRVDHAQVEGSEVRVGVGKGNEHGVVHDASTTSVDLTSGLVGVTGVGTGLGDGSVGHVELVDPGNELRLASGGGGDVAAVRTDGLAGSVPDEADLLAGEGEGLGAVVGDTRAAGDTSLVQVDAGLDGRDVSLGRVGSTVAGALPISGVVGVDAVDVGLVGDVQRREVLPCEAGGTLGAGADVRSEESPGPRLGDTSLEPDGHRVETAHLAEDHLLTSLGGDGLGKELTNLAGVEVVDETPNTRLTPAGKDLVEVDELADVGERVVVSALRRGGVSEHVGQKGSVALLLLSHEGDQRTVLSSEASSDEVLIGEDGETIVEQVELDPLLVETKSDGLVVEVGLDHVTRLSAVGSEATSRCVREGLSLSELSIGVVVRCRGVRRKHRDRRAKYVGGDSAGGGGSLAVVRTVRCVASHNGAALGTGSSGTSCNGGSEGGRNIRGGAELGSERSDGSRRLGDPSGICVQITRHNASLVVGRGFCRVVLRRAALRCSSSEAAKDRGGQGGSGVHVGGYRGGWGGERVSKRRAARLYVGRDIVEVSGKHGTIVNACGLCAGRATCHDGE